MLSVPTDRLQRSVTGSQLVQVLLILTFTNCTGMVTEVGALAIGLSLFTSTNSRTDLPDSI